MKRVITPEYRAWYNMKSRCQPEYAQAKDYHDRGIRVCDRWRESFAAFLEDVGPRPSPLHTIDREDNDRGYEPGNVRWSTRSEQQLNRRNARYLTLNGETLRVTEWAARLGIRIGLIRIRLHKGWPVEKVLNPVRFGHKITSQDVADIRRAAAGGADPRDIQKRYGLSRTTIREILTRSHWRDVA